MTTNVLKQAYRRGHIPAVVFIFAVLLFLSGAAMPGRAAEPGFIGSVTQTPSPTFAPIRVVPLNLPPQPTPAVQGASPLDEGYLSQAVWSPNGTMLAVGSATGVYLYDRQSFAQRGYIPVSSWVTGLAFSPDGSILATASLTGVVQLWRAADGSPIRALTERRGQATSPAFAPGGVILAVGYWDGAIRLWDVNTGVLLAALTGHAGPVRAVAYAPNGLLLASGSVDGSVRLWRADNGGLLNALKGEVGEVSSVVFSPDSQFVLASFGDGSVRLWRVSDGRLVRVVASQAGGVTDVDWSPDGALLAWGATNGLVSLWRASDGTLVSTLPDEQANPVVSIAFAPDGQALTAGAANGQIRVIPLDGLVAPVIVQQTPPPLAQPTPLPPVVIVPGQVTPISIGTANCVDNAAFVADVTIPDYTALSPNERFDKTWRVRNTGACDWGPGYQLVFVAQNILGAPNAVGVPFTAPGKTADITVPMIAPATPGVYVGTWQMRNANGNLFGQKVQVIIQTQPVSTPTTTTTATVTVTPPATQTPPPPPSGPIVEISASREQVNAGESTTIRARVEGVTAAWLDAEPIVGGYKEKKVRPCYDTTYVLDANLPGGGQITRVVKVYVNGVCKPDLKVTRLNADEDRPEAGENVTISYTVKNEGLEPTNTFNVDIVWDNMQFNLAQDLSLSPGQEFSSSLTQTAPANDFDVKIMADPLNSVAETDEGNNERKIRIKPKP